MFGPFYKLMYYFILVGCYIFEDRNITIYKTPALTSENDKGSGVKNLCKNVLVIAQAQYSSFLKGNGSSLPRKEQFSSWLSSLPLLTQFQVRKCFESHISGIHSQLNNKIFKPTCWFIIPTITKQQHELGFNTFGFPTNTTIRTNIDVQQTYLNVRDI